MSRVASRSPGTGSTLPTRTIMRSGWPNWKPAGSRPCGLRCNSWEPARGPTALTPARAELLPILGEGKSLESVFPLP
ncbi:hypothetical protein NITHO_2250006 [Nitrolancea hollandica Lb]|uniref:Uncharacterized protein n=1 Tax=Nitrolancea hollandica Lb TaxID=1129897 RepID=I4EFB6_9BACT|nr:hypothetical protein NITHO_2250006 [Nitrolancea hollandica Lb]